jgi:hypothetical protein
MSTYPPYLPPADADFALWLENFSTLLTATPTDFGLEAADAVAVDAVNTTFQAAYTTATDPSTRTTPTIAAKDNARASAEAVVRPYAVTISQNAAVTDLNKASIGVTVRSTTPTPIPAPSDAPTLALVNANIMTMRLSYKVAGQSGKAKPFGAVGVEIYRSIGTVAATDPAQATFNGIVTKSPFTQAFNAEDQGKICTYFARYVTRSGPSGVAQTGPWSAALTVTVI